MRVLAILYCYPPLLVPASICYLKLMAGLVENDVEVEVVTIVPESFRSPGGPIPLDASLGAVVPPDVVEHRVHSPEATLPIRALLRLDGSRRWTRRWLEPKKREWTAAALKQLSHLDLSRYDVLLSCSQPHANHLLGLEWKRRTGLPWIAYFSDPWTDNPYASFASDGLRRFHLDLEEEVHAEADLVLFTCEEMRRLVASKHTGLDDAKTGVLPHAFVPSWYDRDRSPDSGANGLHVLHAGGFYGPRTPRPFFEALRDVGRELSLEGTFRLDSYGVMAPEHPAWIDAEGLADVVGVHGFIPYLESLSLMRAHDALLLIDAPLTTTEESVFLPSKLVDYLGSGRPILAVTPERGATARVVRETGGVVCPLERPEELREQLRRTIQAGRVDHEPVAEAVGEYDFRRVGGVLARMMQTLVG